jgi:hypothetical protein
MPRPKDWVDPGCSIPGCENPHDARGWCSKHYLRWKSHGDPLGGGRRFDWPESLLRRLRFCPPTSMPTGCVEWTGATDRKGYGEIHSPLSPKAHRASYELIVGPIPAGHDLDHVCENPPCVNPGHLDPVTREEHARRGRMRHTHCRRGHPRTPENTIVSQGRRWCRVCRYGEATPLDAPLPQAPEPQGEIE